MSTGGLSEGRLDRMHDVMADYVERGEVPGLVMLVSRQGEVHVDALGTTAVGSSDPMRRDTIFRIDSLTKPITAAAAMILVEECKLRLDDPVDRWLPELADRQVLRSIDSPLDDTVPATRPITVRDLLTFRLGIGAVMAPPGQYPIQKAMDEAGLAPGPERCSHPPDELMKRFGSLPLIHQPGERWMYHSGSDILGVLITRVSGRTLGTFLRDRIFEPLGMKDTGFSVPESKLDRFATAYRTDADGDLVVYDEACEGRYATPPILEAGGDGLVSTGDDYLAFCRMLLNEGTYDGERILSRPSVELMTTDQLTPEQKAGAGIFFRGNSGWGFGMSVVTQRDELAATPGRFGWNGGIGTSAYSDPQEALIGILLTQRMMESPDPPNFVRDFWTSVYQAIDD